MSIFGPAELCAIVMTPEAISSTTAIPKCSFRIVCTATLASLNSLTSFVRSTFTSNVTESSISSSFASYLRLSRMRSSSMSLTEPMTLNLASLGSFGFTCAHILSYIAWSFSGLNCAKEMRRFLRGMVSSPVSLIRSSVSTGGYLKKSFL